MRTWFSSSMDHNQMLVVSVVLHLLAIVVIMFLPKSKIIQKRIIPSFKVEVVEIPAQRIGEPRKEPKAAKLEPPPSEALVAKEPKVVEPPPVKEAEKPVAPLVKKTEAPKSKTPAPKPVKQAETPRPKPPVLIPLEKKNTLPEKPAPSTSKTVEELEHLEEKPKTAEPIKELDRLAKLESPLTPQKKAPVKTQKLERPAPVEDKEVKQEPLKKTEHTEPEAEFDALAQKPLSLEKEAREKSAIDLAEELRRQMLLDSVKSQKIRPEVTARQVDLSVVSKPAFNSALRKLEIHDSKKNLPEGQKASPLPHPKSSTTDPLSLYAGAIEEKIYSNWKSPLGSKSNEVHVSFFLFPKGNIGKPFVEKSSGNEQLDALAIRAILDSEPFPGFPPDLKEPSLHFTIHFRYIPQG